MDRNREDLAWVEREERGDENKEICQTIREATLSHHQMASHDNSNKDEKDEKRWEREEERGKTVLITEASPLRESSVQQAHR